MILTLQRRLERMQALQTAIVDQQQCIVLVGKPFKAPLHDSAVMLHLHQTAEPLVGERPPIQDVRQVRP